MVSIKVTLIILVIEKKQYFPFTGGPYEKTRLYYFIQIHPARN